MSKPELAGRFLQERLPSEVVELLSPKPPELLPGSFVDEGFALHHSDLLFRLQLKTGDPAFAYLLLELHPYLVSFRHALVDLPRIDDDALSADTRLSAYLKALKYGRRKDLPERIEVIMMPTLEDVDMEHILRYIAVCPRIVSVDNLQTGLRFVERGRREKIMGHFTQEFEAIGEARGQARALLRLLEKRFGTVSLRLRERIATADVASIEAWFERALDVHDLNSVFELSEIA